MRCLLLSRRLWDLLFRARCSDWHSFVPSRERTRIAKHKVRAMRRSLYRFSRLRTFSYFFEGCRMQNCAIFPARSNAHSSYVSKMDQHFSPGRARSPRKSSFETFINDSFPVPNVTEEIFGFPFGERFIHHHQSGTFVLHKRFNLAITCILFWTEKRNSSL